MLSLSPLMIITLAVAGLFIGFSVLTRLLNRRLRKQLNQVLCDNGKCCNPAEAFPITIVNGSMGWLRYPKAARVLLLSPEGEFFELHLVRRRPLAKESMKVRFVHGDVDNYEERMAFFKDRYPDLFEMIRKLEDEKEMADLVEESYDKVDPTTFETLDAPAPKPRAPGAKKAENKLSRHRRKVSWKRIIAELEGKIAWWNELSPGVGLLFGYLLYLLNFLATAPNVIAVEVQVPVMDEVVIGYIPPESYFRVNPTQVELNAIENTQPVTRLGPVFDGGKPTFETVERTFEGIGDPVVRVERREVVSPAISDVRHNVVKVGGQSREYRANFYPEITYRGTGAYYDEKVVTFPDQASPDQFAVRMATLFAAMAILLFLIRSLRKMFSLYQHGL